MIVAIENTKTGEERTLEVQYGTSSNIPAFWRAKPVPPKNNVPLVSIARPEVAIEILPRKQTLFAAQLATMISGWGLPTSMTLSAIRWLLGNDCPFCQVGGEFLKLLEDGKIGEAECKELVIQVLNAKDQNDEVRLAALKGRLEELRNLI